ncbi:MAG: DUF2817 domain-containing protein, partial [Pseudomonadota bacterium]
MPADLSVNIEDCFSSTYVEARSKFLSAVRNTDARVETYINPNAKGPEGEDLATDTAWFGPSDASRVLMVFSGTHGQEFYAGAASQVYWVLNGNYRSLPDDVAVLFVHANNPYGCAYMSRATEEHIDPNRNFLDHDKGHYTDPDY